MFHKRSSRCSLLAAKVPLTQTSSFLLTSCSVQLVLVSGFLNLRPVSQEILRNVQEKVRLFFGAMMPNERESLVRYFGHSLQFLVQLKNFGVKRCFYRWERLRNFLVFENFSDRKSHKYTGGRLKNVGLFLEYFLEFRMQVQKSTDTRIQIIVMFR